MAAPVGNRNGAKKQRMLSDCLKRELTQSPEDVLAISRKLIESAKAGESWAMSLIHDRVDGKLPQPVVGDNDEDPISMTNSLLVELVKSA